MTSARDSQSTMLACVLVLVACSSRSPRPEPISAATPDAAIVTPHELADAAPRDVLATTLLPVDAAPTVIVTTSDPCGFILDIIYFPEGSSAISKQSQPVLDASGEMLACFVRMGDISLFEVSGHADDSERDAQRLSDQRAVNVANALAAKGVPVTAMTPVGYGSTQPIDRKKTAAARAKNRRVQFLILKRKTDD